MMIEHDAYISVFYHLAIVALQPPYLCVLPIEVYALYRHQDLQHLNITVLNRVMKGHVPSL